MMENRNPVCPPVNENCSELMDRVCEAEFFAHDLKLYLDTHPNDTHAIAMYREAVKQYEAYKDAFEKCCYPLRAYSAGEEMTWDWLCGAWPSERI